METKYTNKKIAILGLGVEGVDLALYLQNFKTEITILDEKEEDNITIPPTIKKSVKYIFGKKAFTSDLSQYNFIFRSPGVYPLRDEIIHAVKQGVMVSSAVKLFFEKSPCKIIGVTGTKGKGTTSTLIYEILKTAGCDVHLAGNIGIPFLSLLPKLNRNSIVVLELSSFQLMDLDKSPHIAVILNITADHLDWHASINEYRAAKKNIVKFQNDKDYAVINNDYEVPKSFSKIGKGKKYAFSIKNSVEGSYVDDNMLITNLNNTKTVLGNTADLLLRGKHNWENVLAALTVAKVLNIKSDAIKAAVFSFRGLEHRLELVREVGGIKYYNDSFSTGPDPVIAAIKSFTEPITLILGGYDKLLNYEEMIKQIKLSSVKNILLIGQISQKLMTLITKENIKVNVDNLGKTDMKIIVDKARQVTKSGGVVLLSPGAASFDMFTSYKQRGALFKACVERLQ
ncbi:UDP-N-acetylmuramoyl-L-alanine--D-glutamate ligase [Candidatus Woesebacteria bacterium]|nr:MAG: UDP-N-acetylmuramoyl-L-alanine--D-glutamate ligase [Candidatus Woesebacteria bacterium]